METATYKLRNSENSVVAEFVSTVEPHIIAEFLTKNAHKSFNKHALIQFLREKGINENIEVIQHIPTVQRVAL